MVEGVGKLPPNDASAAAGLLLDLDADGDLDAALAGLPDRLLRNDGTGAFRDASAGLPPGATLGRHVSAGDVDGDGDPDLLFTLYSAFGLQLLANDGTGAFTGASAGLPASSYVDAAELADVDGDGDLDALVLDQEDRVFVNDGSGVFQDDPGALPAGIYVIRPGDLDRDGDLDAVTDAWMDIVVLLNDGAGAFAVSDAPLPALENHPADLALADFDGDGVLDVYIANSSDIDVPGPFERQDRIYLGDGLGGLADAPGALPLVQDATWAVAAADFDGDGDTDAFVGGAGQERVYLNLARQLARRAVPRVGKPLVLDLHGPAGAPWLLFSAPSQGRVDLGALGTFLLFAPRTSLVGIGLLDPEGHAAATFAAPADPGLIGKTLWWQALIGAGLSNVERTTATGL